MLKLLVAAVVILSSYLHSVNWASDIVFLGDIEKQKFVKISSDEV